jgi:hypothetical protein
VGAFGVQAHGGCFAEKSSGLLQIAKRFAASRWYSCCVHIFSTKALKQKNYFYTKKRRLSIYKQTPRHFANAPSHHPRPHLIPPPRSTRNPNLSCLPRRSLSPPALPSLVSLPPPSSHHLYCGVAAVVGAGTSALLILLHRGHHLLDGASAGGGADAG